MPARASLRILLNPSRLEKPGGEALALANKVATNFLMAHWSYPRKHATVSPTAFSLDDPLASAMVPERLQSLAADLQTQLFGAADTGDVTLVLADGTENETALFAVMPSDEIRQLLLAHPSALKKFFSGNVSKVTARSVSILQEVVGDSNPSHTDLISQPVRACFRGVFILPKQEFIGSMASRWSVDDARHTGVLDGPSFFPNQNHHQFDGETIHACLDVIAKEEALPGLLYLPLHYAGIAKRQTRDAYLPLLQSLSHLPKAQLIASLYDLPRDPFHATIAEVTDFLKAHFGGIDLLVGDPGFNVTSLSQASVRSITLSLPQAEDVLRQAALRRFAANRDDFRRFQILPGVANVRSAADLALCAAHKLPLVSGAAVTDILRKPLGVFPYITDGLPLTELGDV